MTRTKEDLYRSILFRAAEIYEVSFEDVERDIGQQFDPVVRFMAGALASELEQVYLHLNETEGRLQRRLAQVLLPEYFHLPQPAHALATAKASSDSIVIDETTSFVKETEDEDFKTVSFTPIFPVQILPAEVKLILTENQLIDVGNQARFRRRSKQQESQEVRRIALGIEATESITEWQGASLFFDLKGSTIEGVDRALLFAALAKGKCYFHGHELDIQSGIPESNLILEDYLNGNERLHQTVRARYERHFVTFLDTKIPEVAPIETQTFLQDWFAKMGLEEGEINNRISKLDPELNKPMYWLEIELGKSVEINQVNSRLSVRLNVFPVVNRCIHGNAKGEHHWLRTNSIKWVALKPEEDFLSIRRVYEDKPPEFSTFTFKPFAEFKEERKPSFSGRYSSPSGQTNIKNSTGGKTNERYLCDASCGDCHGHQSTCGVLDL